MGVIGEPVLAIMSIAMMSSCVLMIGCLLCCLEVEVVAFPIGPRVVSRLRTKTTTPHRGPLPTPDLLQPKGRPRTDVRAVSNPWIGAATTLAGSSAIGFLLERRVIPNSGILSTLLVAAFASNVLHVAPTTHVLYDVCWSTLLPGSLALLLLSMKPRSKEEQADGMIAQSILRVAPGFLFASLGSLIGCYISFALCLRFPSSPWLLPPSQALPAAACLLASYIGGTVNFFATAAAIAPRSNSSLLSAMAGADIMVMAVYFAALSAMLPSRRLQSLFASERPEPTQRGGGASNGAENVPGRRDASIAGIIPSLVLASVLVELAKRGESVLRPLVPGTACAFLAGGIPLLTQSLATCNHSIWRSIQQTSEPLSGFLFLFLFASIGVTADLRVALQQGPACLLFAGTALALHGVITLVGAWAWQRMNRTTYSLEDVLIASNAAIGGPATAAAFCGQIEGVSESRKLGQTIAATIWGVVGYAMGTTLGISFFRLLRRCFVV